MVVYIKKKKPTSNLILRMNQSTVSISDDEVKVTLGQPNRFNTSVGNGYEHDSKSINSTPSKISKFTYNGTLITFLK